MTAKTPAQLACESFWAAVRRQNGGQDAGDWPGNAWDWAHERNSREAWAEAAQAVLNDAFPGLREQVRLARTDRDQLRKRMLDLADEIDESARGDDALTDAAAKIRKGLDL